MNTTGHVDTFRCIRRRHRSPRIFAADTQKMIKYYKKNYERISIQIEVFLSKETHQLYLFK